MRKMSTIIKKKFSKVGSELVSSITSYTQITEKLTSSKSQGSL